MMKKLNLNKVEFLGNLDEIIIQKMKKIKKIKKIKKQSGKKVIFFIKMIILMIIKMII